MGWDMEASKQDARNATQGLELEVDTVRNNPSQGHILFKNNRVSHREMKKFVDQLNTEFEYSKLQITSHAKEIRRFNQFVDDKGEFTFTTRTYVIVDQNGRVPSEKDVGSVFSDFMEVMNLSSDKGKVIFETNTVFMDYADSATSDLGIDDSSLKYTSKLLEIENEIVGAT